MAAKIKKGDTVVVIAGRDKGRSGEVLETRRDEHRVLVRGVNVVKRHQRQSATQEGGIISKEAPIHLSNIALADPKDKKPTRVGFKFVGKGDDRAAIGRIDARHFAGAALVAAGEHDNFVALLDLSGHHSTSGASEMILTWFLARNSRGTGPKIRVPTGSICGLISTAALRSKRITEPSARRMSLAVRTTTAFITSPFFTRPRGMASLIDTTMMSPIDA